MNINVPQIIAELEAAGLSDTEIRLRCGVKSRSAVSAWRSGEKLPSLLPGIQLLLAHAEFCPGCSPLRTVLKVKASDVGVKPVCAPEV